MEKTRVKLNICGVDITVSGDVDREAVERIAQAVRQRMESVLQSSGTATVEKAAVLTAMNFCEELARREDRYRTLEKRAAALDSEAKALRDVKRQLAQTEAKLHTAEEQLRRAEEKKKQTAAPPPTLTVLSGAADGEAPKDNGEALKNPLRATPEEQEGFRSFYAKK